MIRKEVSVSMCGGHHHHGGRGFGRRRHGFPNREEWLEHLQQHEERLQNDLANVRELIERLGPAAASGGEQPAV
jgi:hypothetical protein